MRIENGFRLNCNPFTGRPFVKILSIFLAFIALGQFNAFAQQAPSPQWRYRPTTLEGKAVEVDTTIDVIFALNY